MKQKYFDNNINWYKNPNAMKFIQKFYGINDEFTMLGFIRNGTVAIFISEEIYHEKTKIPYFYVQNFDGVRFKVDYKFKLIDKEYKRYYNELKSDIFRFMNLKYTKDGSNNILDGIYVYNHFHLIWNFHQIRHTPFSRIFWNNILFNRYEKKYY